MIFHTDYFYGTKARPALPLEKLSMSAFGCKKFEFSLLMNSLIRKLAIMRLPELFNLILASG